MEPLRLDWCFVRTFLNKITNMNARFYSEIHVLFMLQYVLSFPVKCFLNVYLPFYFIWCLNAMYNCFRIHTCYALAIVSDIHKSFFWSWYGIHPVVLYINGLFMFLSYRLKINEWLSLNNYLAFVEVLSRKLCIISICFDSIAQWLYVLFQPST